MYILNLNRRPSSIIPSCKRSFPTSASSTSTLRDKNMELPSCQKSLDTLPWRILPNRYLPIFRKRQPIVYSTKPYFAVLRLLSTRSHLAFVQYKVTGTEQADILTRVAKGKNERRRSHKLAQFFAFDYFSRFLLFSLQSKASYESLKQFNFPFRELGICALGLS